MYELELSQRAQRFLDKFDTHIKLRIEETLKRLKENSVPSDSKFIGRDE